MAGESKTPNILLEILFIPGFKFYDGKNITYALIMFYMAFHLYFEDKSSK